MFSDRWDNAGATDAGAVTFGNGLSGVAGTVSAANSLVGSTSGDRVGFTNDGVFPVTTLSNGNYVVKSRVWDNGTIVDAGAVTFGNGEVGVSGPISATNSLVGTSPEDRVGDDFVTELANGNYVVKIPRWDNGAIVDAGAVTFGSGVTGIQGTVSATNSLVGSTANDHVGGFFSRINVLSNGNYLVRRQDLILG